MNASLRYTLRHARRAVVKSLLAILLALLLAAAVGRLDALRRHYDALCHSVEVRGVVSGGLSVYKVHDHAVHDASPSFTNFRYAASCG